MKRILFIFSMLGSMAAFGQLTVTSGLTASQYVDFLVGAGITYSNATYSGNASSIGTFVTGVTPTNLGMSQGIIMSSGFVDANSSFPIGSAVGNFVSATTNSGSDPQLQALIPSYTIYDATKLEFDFLPESDTIKFQYVFGSEEYPEWVGSSFNDVFGFFVSGPNPLGGNYTNYNIARIPGTALPVTIDNINSGSYSQYYVDNQTLGGTTIVYDGFTTVLTAWLVVVPCVQYHIKLAVGDAGDQSYDSGVFLLKNSFNSPTVTTSVVYSNGSLVGNFAMEAGCNDVELCFSLADAATSNFTFPITVAGTVTNGVDFSLIPDSLTIPAGQDSICIVISPYADYVSEGVEDLLVILTNQVGCSGSSNDTTLIQILDYDSMNLVMTPDTSICNDTVFISAFPSLGFPPYNYSWNNGLPALAGHDVAPTTNTTYVVTITDFCNHTVTGDVLISISTGYAEAGPDVEICLGDSTTLTANAGVAYLWSTGDTTQAITVSPAATTQYSVTVTTACLGSDSVTVTVNPLPNIAITLTPNAICEGENSDISASGANTYLWNTGSTLQSFSVNPTSSTYYSVTGTDLNGCTGTSEATLQVNPLPVITAFADPNSICLGEEIQISALGAVNYLWESSPVDASLVQDVGQPNDILTVMPLTNTTYIVTGTDANGCTGSADVSVSVSPLPVASFFTQPPVASSFNPFFQFYDNSLGNPVIWQWILGDGTLYDTPQFEHTFPVDEYGDYDVYLYVENAFGCSDTIRGTVHVKPDYTLYIPNAFTPNKPDGRNDKFHISGINLPDKGFSIRIYNRNGELVYVSSNPAFEWDGHLNGELLPQGTYVYRLFYNDTDGNDHVIMGNITLIH